MKTLRAVALAVAATIAVAAQVRAQSAEIRGVVRDSATGRPVSGAVVMALDAVGTTLSRVITGERGQYRLTRPEGTMLVRAIRLGYRPITERLPLVRAEQLTLDLTIVTMPRLLETVAVTAAQGCPTRGDRADAYALLDQARAGLLATVVARERQPAMLHVLRYERYLDLDGIEIERQVVRLDSSRNARTSFNAVQSAIDFVARGFRAGPVGQYTYYGPDADVLLDDRFQRGYCFSLAATDTARHSQVGLRFTAANRRDNRVDIDGTLWIDTTARALTEIVFRYVGVEALAESFSAGGHVGFRTLPNGVPFIDRWSLRLVGAPDTLVTAAGLSSQIYAVREVGGVLARAEWPDGISWSAPLASVNITAVLRSGESAVNTVLNLVGTDYRVRTDNGGRARIERVLPGPYTFAVDDPRLTSIGLQIPTGHSLTARGASTALIRVVIPTAEAFVGAMCNRDYDVPKPTEAWLLARVVGNDGRPVAGAKWRVSAADGSRWRIVSDNGITGANGLAVVCRGLVRGSSAEVASWRDPKDAVRIQRILESPLTIVRVPLPSIATVASAPATERSADSGPMVTISGSVKDSSTGALVADARVTILGTPFEGATDSSGTFVIGGMRRGVYTVEVSTPSLDSIGAVTRSDVTVTDSPVPLALFLPSRAAILSASCGSSDATGFLTGRISTRGASTLPPGLRVIGEWTPPSVDTTVADSPGIRRVAWIQTPVDANGTYRLCGVPANTRVALRTETDSTTSWGSLPLALQLPDGRRFARADLLLDSSVVAFASFTGTVIADTTGVPIESAEVTITDIARTVLTDRRGAFRMSEVPVGPHFVSVKRVGYAPVLLTLAFESNTAVEQRVMLTRATTLAAVTISAEARLRGFEERRQTGIGRFFGPEELDKNKGRRLGDALTQVTGFGAVNMAAGHAWVVGKRAPAHLAPLKKQGINGAALMTKDDFRDQGYYCPTTAELSQGVPQCACFAQVFLDGMLLNPQRPTEPFDANTLPIDDLAGVEFYPSPASTPSQYSSLNAVCGVLLVWTRR